MAEAPDKIYVKADKCMNGSINGNWNVDPFIDHSRDVVYVRKDALLEWARNYEISVCEQLIDKLNSM